MGKPPKLENAGSTDREILDRAKCTIEIGGKTYEWTEMGRRQGREALAELLPLLQGYRPDNDAATMLTLLNQTLDFFYKYHARMRADKAVLDNAATNDEISTALLAIRAVIDAPFRRDAVEAREIVDATLTPSPESSS